MIEIKYNEGNYSFKHDEKIWTEDDLTNHLADNWHERVVTGFGGSHKNMAAYEHCSKLAKKFDAIFDERELPMNARG